MTQTKKHKSMKARIAAEDLYQRAAAEWVARQIGKSADTIEDVDFGMGNNGGCSTCWEEFPALTYRRNGKEGTYQLQYPVTPGQFLKECLEIYNELLSSKGKDDDN